MNLLERHNEVEEEFHRNLFTMWAEEGEENEEEEIEVPEGYTFDQNGFGDEGEVVEIYVNKEGEIFMRPCEED